VALRRTEVTQTGYAGGSSRASALEAQRAAAEARQQAALDRKAAALADRERRKQEAAARKQVPPTHHYTKNPELTSPLLERLKIHVHRAVDLTVFPFLLFTV
jgi:hypothetical protein